jgi:hypothetical protein
MRPSVGTVVAAAAAAIDEGDDVVENVGFLWGAAWAFWWDMAVGGVAMTVSVVIRRVYPSYSSIKQVHGKT